MAKIYPNTLPELRYPLSLKNEDKWIAFTPFVYKRSSRKEKNARARNFGTRIVLPLPSNLTNSYSANYSNQEQGAMQRASAMFGEAISNKSITNARENYNSKLREQQAKHSKVAHPKAFVSSMKDIFNSTLTSGAFREGMSIQSDNAISGMIDAGARTVGIDLESGLSGIGYTRNPHMATLYTGVDFKGHNFQFSLSAKNASETEAIRDIIKVLKTAQATNIADFTNNLLQYPDEFRIEIFSQVNIAESDESTYIASPSDGGFLFTIGSCVLTNMDIDYHAQGKAIYFKNKAPVSVTLSLTFQETTIVTRNDIEEYGR